MNPNLSETSKHSRIAVDAGTVTQPSAHHLNVNPDGDVDENSPEQAYCDSSLLDSSYIEDEESDEMSDSEVDHEEDDSHHSMVHMAMDDMLF